PAQPHLRGAAGRSTGGPELASGVELVERSVHDGDFRHAISTWVAADPTAAFDYIADMPRHAEWAMNPITVEAVDLPPTHVGSRFRAVGRQGNRDWPSDLVVTAYNRPHRFGFSATGGPIGTTEGHLHRHEFELSPERGGTRLIVRRTDPVPNPLIRLLLPIVTRFALRLRMRTIERLRQRLDALGSAA
ncbi:MAG TPA: SRPBCC family protein, partial [Candidatus Deferrimicrobium sp.]|nr:SRPBCC family protein [Candidatus Deferrimicrobium sp.]